MARNENEMKTAARQQGNIREEDLREALSIIADLTEALEVLHVRLYGLEGVADMGDYAMQAGIADYGAASKTFFSLSESLRDESKRAEDAVQAANKRRIDNEALLRVHTQMANDRAGVTE